MSNSDNFLNLYSPTSYHEEQYVVADRKSLLKLQQAIESALKEGVGVEPLWASDGEGYGLVVVLNENVKDPKVPYRHDWASTDSHIPQLNDEAGKLMVEKLKNLWQ